MSALDTQSKTLPVIFGLAGEALTEEERRFFRDADPFGFILFARNCTDPAQLARLTGDLQDGLGRHVPILIDQEGGRVQRLKPPHWTQCPPARHFGDMARTDKNGARKALAQNTALIARELTAGGINVNCAPVLDVLFPQTHEAIGNRAFSDDPVLVAELGRLVCETYLESGIVPVIKHIPGLGRADLDTHKDLPSVAASRADLDSTDFVPFRNVAAARFIDAVWGMVGHALYTALDDAPTSCSAPVINEVIRKNMGFDGLLLSDDLSMEALGCVGDVADRAVKVLEAGCDIALHCSGKIDEMTVVAKRIPGMTNPARMRYNRTVSWFKTQRQSRASGHERHAV